MFGLLSPGSGERLGEYGDGEARRGGWMAVDKFRMAQWESAST